MVIDVLDCNACDNNIVKYGARIPIMDTAVRRGWEFISSDFKDKETNQLIYERHWLCPTCKKDNHEKDN